MTDHAADRWDERTPPHSVSPETAWKRGQRIISLTRTTTIIADECRLHHPTRSLLLREGFRIATVLSESEFDEDAQEAVDAILGDPNQ